MSAKVVESYKKKYTAIELRVDVHDDGDVFVQFGDEWVNSDDLGDMVRFIEQHAEINLRNP